jgi:hypothetical protein
MTALDGLIDSALKIAHQDAALRRSLKEAILRDDVAKTIETACALVGVKMSGSILAATVKAKSLHPSDAIFVTSDE